MNPKAEAKEERGEVEKKDMYEKKRERRRRRGRRRSM